ncbi:YrhK family protein [Roseibium aggregatum]|uniref:YrhK family protein n=1 Tax=Roseibium aggregatum TaxID=187304 RepID=UPI0025AC8512|nr:YrhK family protein [Roseibium aggregatum]WJS05819.1 YrhK family protein [Roseibium aggregatum]
MPHLFVNRPRLYDLTGDDRDLRRQFRWETLNAVSYKLGGVIFVVGSILFFPALSAYADLGAWAFTIGSLLYLLVTSHDLVEALRYRHRQEGAPSIWDRMELQAAVAYSFGSVLFVVGSVFFLSYVGLAYAGAWCFVLGSLVFVYGATINVLQITQAKSVITLQLMNFTALTFVTGSVLFTVASIPYLWTFADSVDERRTDAFLAWQFVAGSVLFLAGGVFNYWRAYLFVRNKVSEQASAPAR